MSIQKRRSGVRPTWFLAAVGMGLAASPHLAMAQVPGPAPGFRAGPSQIPTARILENADELGLSDEQRESVARIQDEFLEATADARELLEARRQERMEERADGEPRPRPRRRAGDRPELPPEVEEAFANLRSESRQAREEVRETLDASQRAALRELIREERPRGARAERPRRPMRGGPPPAPR